MSKLRGAVIGVGYLGRFHAQKYLNNSQVTLVGVCDHFPAQADKVAAELGVKSFHKPEDLLGHVDLVTIAASTLSHYELAKMFLANGVHVNVEKPMTATVPQGEELIKIAQANNVKLAVGHIERFNPVVLELKKHMVKPVYMELHRLATYKARGADVSVLHDLMIHDIDLLLWLSDSEIESMFCSGARLVSKELDSASVSVKMKNGLHAVINVSRVSSQMQRTVRVVEEGFTLLANTGALEIEKATKTENSEEPIAYQKWTVEKSDALQSETDAFIQAVLNNTEPVVTGLDGLKALKMIEDILHRIED